MGLKRPAMRRPAALRSSSVTPGFVSKGAFSVACTPIKAFRHNLRHRLPCQDVAPQKGRKEPVLFRAGSGNPVEGAALMGKAFVHAYTTILRRRWESMSKMVTTTTMQMSTAQVRGKSKLRMSSQRTRPMPPAPTMPMTVAERTLDSKR